MLLLRLELLQKVTSRQSELLGSEGLVLEAAAPPGATICDVEVVDAHHRAGRGTGSNMMNPAFSKSSESVDINDDEQEACSEFIHPRFRCTATRDPDLTLVQ